MWERAGLVIVALVVVGLFCSPAGAVSVVLDVPAKVNYGDVVTISVSYNGTQGEVHILYGSTYVWNATLSGDGYDEFTIKTLDNLYPRTYTVTATVKDAQGNSASDNATLVVYSPVPVISLELMNGNSVTVGDLAKFRVAVFSANASNYTIYSPNGSVVLNGTLTVGTFETIDFDTGSVRDENGNPVTGWYEMVVRADDQEDRLTFKVEDIEFDLTIPDVMRIGELITFSGTTNVADSGSDYDIGIQNEVSMSVREYSPSGPEILSKDTVVKNGAFDFEVKFPVTLDDGTYYLVLTVTTSDGISKSDYYQIDLLPPEIKVNINSTVVRGEKVEFSVETSLAEGELVKIIIPPNVFKTLGGNITMKVGTGGVITFSDYVDENASAGLQEIRVYVLYNPEYSATKSFEVLEQTLDVGVHLVKVIRGDSFEINGTSTIRNVYVYASEWDVFDGISKVPPLDDPFDVSYFTTRTLVTDKSTHKFKTVIKVNPNVTAGTYYLYLFAPPDNTISLDTTMSERITVIVEDPEITNFTYPAYVVKGDYIELSGEVKTPSPQNTEVHWIFEGTPAPLVREEGVARVEENGGFKIRIDPFLGKDHTPENLLQPSRYYVTLTLYYYGNKVYGIEKKATIQIVEEKLSVDAPDYIVAGQTLNVTVTTNRVVPYHIPLYFVLDGNGKPAHVDNVWFNRGNTYTLSIDTHGFEPGVYYIYVRDTMGTGAEDPLKYYTLDPSDAIARMYGAHDDVLVMKKLTILPPDAAPNLKLEELEISPQKLKGNGTVTVTAIFRNYGKLPAENYTLPVYLDGMVVGNITVSSLDPLETGRYSLDVDVEGLGAHTIQVGGMSREVVVEMESTQETANTTATGNLVVKDIVVLGEAYVGYNTVGVVVENRGDTTASGDVMLYLDGQYVGRKTVTLKPGEFKTVSFNVNILKEGKHVLASGKFKKEINVLPIPTPEEKKKKKVVIPGFDLIEVLGATLAILATRRVRK